MNDEMSTSKRSESGRGSVRGVASMKGEGTWPCPSTAGNERAGLDWVGVGWLLSPGWARQSKTLASPNACDYGKARRLDSWRAALKSCLEPGHCVLGKGRAGRGGSKACLNEKGVVVFTLQVWHPLEESASATSGSVTPLVTTCEPDMSRPSDLAFSRRRHSNGHDARAVVGDVCRHSRHGEKSKTWAAVWHLGSSPKTWQQ